MFWKKKENRQYSDTIKISKKVEIIWNCAKAMPNEEMALPANPLWGDCVNLHPWKWSGLELSLHDPNRNYDKSLTDRNVFKKNIPVINAIYDLITTHSNASYSIIKGKDKDRYELLNFTDLSLANDYIAAQIRMCSKHNRYVLVSNPEIRIFGYAKFYKMTNINGSWKHTDTIYVYPNIVPSSKSNYHSNTILTDSRFRDCSNLMYHILLNMAYRQQSSDVPIDILGGSYAGGQITLQPKDNCIRLMYNGHNSKGVPCQIDLTTQSGQCGNFIGCIIDYSKFKIQPYDIESPSCGLFNKYDSALGYIIGNLGFQGVFPTKLNISHPLIPYYFIKKDKKKGKENIVSITYDSSEIKQ